MAIEIKRALIVGGLVLSAGCAAQSGEETSATSQDISSAPSSAYTSNQNCKAISRPAMPAELASEDSECAEMDGYRFINRKTATQGDGLTIRTDAGEFDIDLSAVGPGLGPNNPGYWGKLAEWRGRVLQSATPADPLSGRVAPTALISRYFLKSGSAEGSFAGRNVLLLIKLTPDAVCLHSTVSGAVANHNQIARDIVDSQDFKDYVCPVRTPRANAPEGCGAIPAGKGLGQGYAQSSCSGSHTLVMQFDGNLVLYNNTSGRATWASGTAGTEGYSTFVHPNGELVLYGKSWDALFQAPTGGHPESVLQVQDDGNLVMYTKTGRPIWATMTQGK